MGGTKHDREKVRLELIAPELVQAVGAVLTYGAEKYGARNWEQGISWGRLFGATLRHLWAWWAGEDTDPETGLSHLAHAACGVMFMLWHEQHRPDLDDRPG
jgi:hypothetical protein